jgi:1-phosphatidylinositol-4-phosphate 5-kinase
MNSPGVDMNETLLKSTFKTIKAKVKIEEMAPNVFAFLRQLDGIDQNEIQASLLPENNIEAAEKAGESQGKSGSFFFFSQDKKFIIKTMTNSDLDTFKKLFVDYANHVSAHKSSLLARVYGIFTIKKEDMVPVHLILMGNTMKVKSLKCVFDLKGSMVNRETKFGLNKASTTLKDINLLKKQKGVDKFLLFSNRDQVEIMKIIERDTKLLNKHNIMDYSLLFAVENNLHSDAFCQRLSIIR